MRDPLSRGVYRYPSTENKLDKYLDSELKAARTKKEEDAFDDIDRMSGVWEKDVDNLTNDFIKYKEKRKEYEKEKDPAKKAAIWQEGIKLGAALETNIAKSKKQKAMYIAKAEQIGKDKSLLLPADSKDMLEEWAGKPIYERPDDIGIEMASTIDFGEEAKKRFFTTVKKPNKTKTTTRANGKDVAVGTEYYTKQDVDDGLEASLNTMDPRFVRAEKIRLMYKVSTPIGPDNPITPEEYQSATKAIATPQGMRDYLKGLIYAKVKPALNVQLYDSHPSPTRGTGGGGADSGVFQVSAAYRDYNYPDGTTQPYVRVSSTIKKGKQPEKEWDIPTDILKQIDQQYGLELGTEDLDANTRPSSTIVGTMVEANLDETTGKYMVVVKPTEYAGNYVTVKKNITIPYEGNEDAVSVYLNGRSLEEVVDDFKSRKPRGEGKAMKPQAPLGGGQTAKKKKKKPY